MLAIQLGCDFYETSAKKNDNVEAAFKSLVRQIQGSKKAEGLGNEPYGGGGIRGGKSRKKKRCVIL
jgi:GTPase SAR1 family protein